MATAGRCEAESTSLALRGCAGNGSVKRARGRTADGQPRLKIRPEEEGRAYEDSDRHHRLSKRPVRQHWDFYIALQRHGEP